MTLHSPQYEMLDLSARRATNVGPLERLVSAALGARMLAASLDQRSWVPRCLSLGSGAYFLHRGLTGRCAAYRRLGLVQDERYGSSGFLRRPIRIGASIEIARPPGEVYSFWRELEPLVSAHESLRRVEVLSRATSAWTVQAGGQLVTWVAHIVEDVPDERIAWESIEGAFRHRGQVDFLPALRGSGTLLSLDLTWFAPITDIAATLGLAKRSPAELARRALKNVKGLLEAGEVSVSGALPQSVRARMSSSGRSLGEGTSPGEATMAPQGAHSCDSSPGT